MNNEKEKENKRKSLLLTSNLAELLIEKMNNNDNEYIQFCNQIQIFKLISPPDSALYIDLQNKIKLKYRLYLGIQTKLNYQIKELCKTILQYKWKNIMLEKVDQKLKDLLEIEQKNVFDFNEEQIDIIIRKVFNCLRDRRVPNFSKNQEYLSLFTKNIDKPSVIYNIPQIDFINRKVIKNPFIFFNKDSLDSCPNLVDQKTYISYFIQEYQQNKPPNVSKTQIDDSYILILIWQIRDLILQKYKIKEIKNVQVDYYPVIKTFLISRIDNEGSLHPLFLNNYHKIRFVRQCSQTQSIEEQKRYFLQNNGVIETEFLEIYSSDKMSDNQKFVSINTQNYKIEDINRLNNKIKQFNTNKQFNTFLIEPKQFEFIHSTECQIKDGELINHKIDLELMICKHCQRKIFDATSLFLNIRFYEIYTNICDILMYGCVEKSPELYLYEGQIKLVEGTNEGGPDLIVWYQRGQKLFTWYLDSIYFKKQEIKGTLKNQFDQLCDYKEAANGNRKNGQELQDS